MTLEMMIAFNLALLAAIASPGPALLMSIRTSIVRGQIAGIFFGVGLGLMASFWTLIALFGLHTAFALFPWAYAIMKIGGALYLFYIAWTTWKGARGPLSVNAKPAKNAVRDGMLLNLSNPKSVLFAAAVLMVIFPPDMTMFEKGTIVANHFLVECICYSMVAILMSSEPVKKSYFQAKAYLDRIAGVIMAGLGLRLLLQR